jgi:hypothetical protein
MNTTELRQHQSPEAYWEPASVGVAADLSAHAVAQANTATLRALEDSRQWITQLAADVAAKVAVEVLRQMLPDDESLRADAAEDALVAVAGIMPELVAAVKADSVSLISRDRDGRMTKVETKHD